MDENAILSGFLKIFIIAPLGWYSLVLFNLDPGTYSPKPMQYYGLFFSMMLGALLWLRNFTTFKA
jgi:hypothetical protein